MTLPKRALMMVCAPFSRPCPLNLRLHQKFRWPERQLWLSRPKAVIETSG
jgi:hypothetical protein